MAVLVLVLLWQWLRDVIALQCSIVRHLSAKQMPSSYWDSEQTEKASVKPCVAGEKSALCSSERPVLPEPFPSPCTAPIGPQGAPAHNSLGPPEERRSCCSCTDRPCQNCGTTNGLLEQPAKTNGPTARGGSPQADLQHRLSGSSGPLPAPGLPNHTAVKTEGVAPSLCAHTDPGPGPQPHRTSPGAAGGQAAALTSRSVSSPTAGTRALTPPRAAQDAGVARLGCPTPPSGESPSLFSTCPCITQEPNGPSELQRFLPKK